MLVFIHDNFRLDLTYLNVTFNEINQWMKDDFSTEFSIPFDLYLDSDLLKNSGFNDHYNAQDNLTIFSGYLDRDGEIVAAILKFISIKGKKITAVINAGIDNFPNFNKQLSEFGFEYKLVNDILIDAEQVIEKTYPETNYNFPMIHTEKYDPESVEYNGFGKIINNYASGQFLINSIVPDSNIDLIKNIMQPLPYLMHILKTGVADSGKTLTGDILTDYDLNKALVWRDGEYFDRTTSNEIPLIYRNDSWNNVEYIKSSFDHVKFFKLIEVEKKGDYLLFGDIFSLLIFNIKITRYITDLSIKISKISAGVETIIYQRLQVGIEHVNRSSNFKRPIRFSVDVAVSLEAGDLIRIEKIEPRRDLDPSPTPDYPEAISLKLIPVRLRNPDGSPIVSVLNKKEIDLKKVVPDITFNELISILKNWFNYDFIPDGNYIYMNKIENQLDRTKAINISEFDIEDPERKSSTEIEYELMFNDGKANAIHKYDSVFVTKNGYTVNNYFVKPTTKSIKIDALPLPVVMKNGVNTAFSYEDQTSKLRLVFMKPILEDELPVAFHNDSVLLEKVYLRDYRKWLNFRITAIPWNWEFVISVEKLKEITIQSIVYAYNNNHLFAEIEKERLNEMYWRVTAKSESFL